MGIGSVRSATELRASRAPAGAGERSRLLVSRCADANREPLGVFVFAAVRFVGRVKEESAVPHSRLVCFHLQSSSRSSLITESAE